MSPFTFTFWVVCNFQTNVNDYLTMLMIIADPARGPPPLPQWGEGGEGGAMGKKGSSGENILIDFDF